MKIAVYRKEHFNAAHRLHNPQWTEEKNKEVFEADRDYVRKCKPKYVKFRDGHREKYNETRHF